MYFVLDAIHKFVWGFPALLLVIFVGIVLSFKTGFAQIRLLPKSLKCFLGQINNGKSKSSRKALYTALAATVGTGNLAGVAGAIAIGGPGAVFWMWVCGLLGMVTKLAEATLAVIYRKKNKKGEYISGPMYMIQSGFPGRWHWLAGVYCFLGVVASFGVGNATQISTVIGGINSVLKCFDLPTGNLLNALIGLSLAVFVGILFFGGAGRVGDAAEKLVPIAAGTYLLLSLFVLIVCYRRIPEALCGIVVGAFSPKAVTGGVIGSFFVSLRIGASRGIFTNEAGMGTAAIAHGAADVSSPTEQGMMGIVEVFIDTIVICTMTALVILCSGVVIPYGQDPGVALTTNAFVAVCGEWASVVIAVSLCLFAVATVMGWGFYGARCAQFLFGDDIWNKYVLLQVIVVFVSAVMNAETLWLVSDILNGLMCIPNLIVLLSLSNVLRNQLKATENLTK